VSLFLRPGNRNGNECHLLIPSIEMEQRMQSRLTFSAVVVATFISLLALSAYGAGIGGPGATGGASGMPSADSVNSQNSGSAGIQSAPGGSSTTGIGSSGSTGMTTGTGPGNQSGVPNTSTPGHIGTGASPSGLPGDDPNAPGYPGRVGK
jgi:hypothetical protein